MKFFPWSGFLYELRRALLSIPLIVLTVIIVLASFGILWQIESTRPGLSNNLENTGAYYFASGEYHFEFYVYDQYGQPVSGVTVNLTAYPSNVTVPNPSSVLANVSGRTTGAGLVEVNVPVSLQNFTATFSEYSPRWTSPYGGGSAEVPVVQPPPGKVTSFPNSFANTVEDEASFRGANELLIFYPGPNGTAPPGYQVYWAAPQNATTFPVAPLPESAMHRLGTLSAARQTFSLVVPVPSGSIPSPPPQTCYVYGCDFGYLQIELFTQGGQLVGSDTNQSAPAFYPPVGLAAGTSIAFGFAGTVMVFLVPLMAVLASYALYGKDRLTGVLEGVLARPVSRLGLVTSRYLAVIAALVLALTVAVVTLDGLIDWVYAGFLPLSVVLSLFGALLVETGAFTGMIFLLSHALRSTGALVGIGLGLFAFFTVGWLILFPLLASLTDNFCTPGYQTAVIELAFLNPTQFLGFAEDLFLGSVQNLCGFGAATTPAAYGISYGSVISAGVAWVLAPAGALVYVVRHHD